MVDKQRVWRRRRALAAGAAALGVVLACCLGVPGVAAASPAPRNVTYDGYRLRVPRSWPVYRLAAGSRVCVRFDRHAVYLGRPGDDPRCPVQAAGRTEAILVQPATGARAAVAAPAVAAADVAGGTVARVVEGRRHLVVTATWRRDPRVIARALGVRSLSALAAASRVRPAVDHTALERAPRARARAQIAAAPAFPGEPYTGAGFDVCSTPSLAQMAGWSAAYQAVAVYIGGANMACAQPNLTGGWVSAMSADGWHLIPIYVGLQAPANSCGCAAISPSRAAAQGTASALDAVAQAQARGLGPGNPIYFDMEAYSRGATNTTAVMTFLSAWTQQLHAAGYASGVYGSDGSGIVDLVAGLGSALTEPDDIWTANWNGVATTDDSVVPSTEWANHQRVHQYSGGHDETHGGVTLNIDSDYVDAATAAAGAGTASIAAVPPQSNRPPAVTGVPVVGQTLTEQPGGWSGAPTSLTVQWETCDGAGNNCVPVAGATGPTFAVTAAALGQTIRASETATNSIGVSYPATSTATYLVQSPPGGGFWLLTGRGNVNQSADMAWYGSTARSRVRNMVGMAATGDGQGYWLVDAAGRVFPFGDAPALPHAPHRYPIAGVVAAPGGGYWLYTAHGNVIQSAGTPWYGSAARARVSDVVGMAATSDGRGYWLVTAAGRVLPFGDAARLPVIRPRHPVRGIVAAPGGGYWLYTTYGNVYRSAGAPGFGSAVRARVTTVAGMAATADGQGYWLVTTGGRVFAFGDAAPLPGVRHPHPIIGITR